MRADLSLSLEIGHVRVASVADLLHALKAWLINANPSCLMHPHGFFVVPLHRSETDDWRFHLWPKGPKTIAGMPGFIHTHDRHVESRILQGELTNITYDVQTVATGGFPVYEVGYGGDRYAPTTSNFLYKTTGRVAVEVETRETLCQGNYYHVERNAYHEALVPEHLTTATLVRMHSRLHIPINVVGCDGYPDKIEFKRAEHRAQEVAELIRQ
jgi:hypothetical protein